MPLRQCGNAKLLQRLSLSSHLAYLLCGQHRRYADAMAARCNTLCWRQATGAILKKQNKPDYTAPKAYRIIALLNCLGKISEKIIATRFCYLAEATDLLHNEQMGGRRYRAAIDAVLCLLHDITKANNNKHILSILFFDVKGAFDHVSKARLLDTMRRLYLDPAVIRWTDTFLSDRQIGLAFDGEREHLKPVSTGIPQGSPISPILFLIYLRFLFTTIQNKHPDTTTPSYIDDVACLVVGRSEEENCRKPIRQPHSSSIHSTLHSSNTATPPSASVRQLVQSLKSRTNQITQHPKPIESLPFSTA